MVRSLPILLTLGLGALSGCFPLELQNEVTTETTVASPSYHLRFDTAPAGATAPGLPLGTPPVVSARTAEGSLAPLNGATVTLSAHSDAACSASAALPYDQINETRTLSAGVADFSAWRYLLAGSIYVRASAPGMTPACAGPISFKHPGFSVADGFIGIAGTGAYHGRAASILGQISPNGTVGGSLNPFVQRHTLNFPGNLCALPGGGLALADTSNSRVLLWTSSIPSGPSSLPDVVLDGPYFGSQGPRAVATDGTRLLVSDAARNRIYVWNTIPTDGAALPDVLIGQPDLGSQLANQGLAGPTARTLFSPRGIAVIAGKLYVADASNHRVLVYNSIPTSSNAAADGVYGQPDLTSGAANRGARSPGPNTLNQPWDIAGDATRIVIVDGGNARVLGFSAPPVNPMGPPADILIGQQSWTDESQFHGPAPTHGFRGIPLSAAFSGSRLFVSESGNRVVAIDYPPAPAIGAPFAFAVGQADLHGFAANRGGPIGASTMSSPRGILAHPSGAFLVADASNNRLLIFGSTPTSSAAAATAQFGQADFTGGLWNRTAYPNAHSIWVARAILPFGPSWLVVQPNDNRLLAFNPDNLAAGPSFALGQTSLGAGTANSGGSPAAWNFSRPQDAVRGGGQLFVADEGNSRIQVYNSAPSAYNSPADFTIAGRAFALFADSAHLLVALPDKCRVEVYSLPIAASSPAPLKILNDNSSTCQWERAMGPSATASTLSKPIHAILADGKLLVFDAGNSRVLVWNSFSAVLAAPGTSVTVPADVVIGQPDMTSQLENAGRTHPHARGFGGGPPTFTTQPAVGASFTSRLAYVDGRLFVADVFNNRVLVFDGVPTQSYAPAAWVLGRGYLASPTALLLEGSTGDGQDLFGFTRLFGIHHDTATDYLYFGDTGRIVGIPRLRLPRFLSSAELPVPEIDRIQASATAPLRAGQCGQLTLQAMQGLSVAPLASNLTASVSATTGTFYSDAGCVTPASSATISATGSTGTLYYVGGTAGVVPVTWTASGLSLEPTFLSVAPGPASSLVIAEGNLQTASAGAAVATAPKVRATDSLGNGVPGVPVFFKVTGGGGSVGSATVITDPSGYASTAFTVGTTPGGSNTLIASLDSDATDLLNEPDLPTLTTYGSTTTVLGLVDPDPPAVTASADAAVGSQASHVHSGAILNSGSTFGGATLNLPATAAGTTYRISFWAKSLMGYSIPLFVSVQNGNGDENTLTRRAISVGPAWAHYSRIARLDAPKNFVLLWVRPQPSSNYLLDGFRLQALPDGAPPATAAATTAPAPVTFTATTAP
jgi:hypothetical protein